MKTFVDDDVLIFYVPVKDVLRPQIEDSGHQLGRDRTSSLALHISEPILLSFAFYLPCTYLSKDVAGQGLIKPWLHVYEFKKV